MTQFLNGRREGPIGMSEEKDQLLAAAELAGLKRYPDLTSSAGGTKSDGLIPPVVRPSPGVPERQAVARRQARVRDLLHTLPAAAQSAVLAALGTETLVGSGDSR